MKMTTESNNFKPITIIVETVEEAQDLYWGISGSGYRNGEHYPHIEDLEKLLKRAIEASGNPLHRRKNG